MSQNQQPWQEVIARAWRYTPHIGLSKKLIDLLGDKPVGLAGLLSACFLGAVLGAGLATAAAVSGGTHALLLSFGGTGSGYDCQPDNLALSAMIGFLALGTLYNFLGPNMTFKKWNYWLLRSGRGKEKFFGESVATEDCWEGVLDYSFLLRKFLEVVDGVISFFQGGEEDLVEIVGRIVGIIVGIIILLALVWVLPGCIILAGIAIFGLVMTSEGRRSSVFAATGWLVTSSIIVLALRGYFFGNFFGKLLLAVVTLHVCGLIRTAVNTHGKGGGVPANWYLGSPRRWLFWLRPRPSYGTLVEALQAAVADRATWVPNTDGAAAPLKHWVGQLGRGAATSPADYLAAMYALECKGAEAVMALVAVWNDQNSDRCARVSAKHLILNIARENRAKVLPRSGAAICPNCLARFQVHRLWLEWRPVNIYACRLCWQDKQWLEVPGDVVAVIDRQMFETQSKVACALQVNWLKQQQKLFDFDRVEIRQASDEDVERFAVQVQNDTDPFRVCRYKNMRCAVSRQAGLSENTIRILRSIFGEVVVEQMD